MFGWPGGKHLGTLLRVRVALMAKPGKRVGWRGNWPAGEEKRKKKKKKKKQFAGKASKGTLHTWANQAGVLQLGRFGGVPVADWRGGAHGFLRSCAENLLLGG